MKTMQEPLYPDESGLILHEHEHEFGKLYSQEHYDLAFWQIVAMIGRNALGEGDSTPADSE